MILAKYCQLGSHTVTGLAWSVAPSGLFTIPSEQHWLITVLFGCICNWQNYWIRIKWSCNVIGSYRRNVQYAALHLCAVFSEWNITEHYIRHIGCIDEVQLQSYYLLQCITGSGLMGRQQKISCHSEFGLKQGWSLRMLQFTFCFTCDHMTQK